MARRGGPEEQAYGLCLPVKFPSAAGARAVNLGK